MATVNDDDVKLVKAQGEFVWHQHQDTDELFLVIDGQLRIQLQDHGDVVLGPGELFVVATWGAPLSSRRAGDPGGVPGAA